MKIENKTKNPLFKFRYVNGLGDLIRCIIHSKLVSFLIKDPQYCLSCSQRSDALNILVKIPLWKLFFKTKEEMENSIKEDAKQFGYIVVEKEPTIDITPDSDINPDPTFGKFDINQIKYDGFYFASKTEDNYDNIRIVTMVFKKIDN
jgi:hypothetical protein